jgi:hypothetical protein
MSKPIYRVEFESLTSIGGFAAHRFADHGYLTPAGETPASTFIDGRVVQPGLLRRDLYGQAKTRGDVMIGNGAVILANVDGELDDLLDYGFDGQNFFIYEVDQETYALATLPMFSGVAEQPIFDLNQVTFAVRDQNHAFDVELLTTRYAGTNVLPAGVEGTAGDIKGKVKPKVVGIALNVSPVCVNTSRQIYQVDGQDGLRTGWSMVVYDKRSVLTAGAVYTSQADMETNAPTAGQYRVWPAGGMFRTNAAHTLLTADVTNPTQYGTTGCEVSSVLRFISGASVFESHLDSDPDCGIYLRDEVTVLAAINMVAPSVNAFFAYQPSPTGASNLGYLCSQLCDPSSLPYTPVLPVVDLDEDNIIESSLQRIAPNEPERGLPVWRVNVQYAKNNTVMGLTDLAGVALADQTFAGIEFRTATASDANVKLQWPDAPELNVVSLIDAESDAQSEADRLLDLHSVSRSMFKLSIPAEIVREIPAVGGAAPRMFGLHSRVRVTYDRFGLDAGVVFLVVGIQQNHEDDTVELIIWG